MTDTDIQKNRQDTAAAIKEVQGDPRLSDGYKAKRISRRSAEGEAKHKQLVAETKAAKEQDLAQKERAVFSLPFGSSVVTDVEKESVRQSYQSALSLTVGKDASELERLYERAQRVGLKMLATACYHESVEKGFTPCKITFRSAVPGVPEWPTPGGHRDPGTGARKVLGKNRAQGMRHVQEGDHLPHGTRVP